MTDTQQPDLVNDLLKFNEGIEAGLKPQDIVKMLYGGLSQKDILEKLEQLKLITRKLRKCK